MRLFLREFLEPLAYFIYAVVFYLQYSREHKTIYRLFFVFYSLVFVSLIAASFINIYDGYNNYIYNSIYFLKNLLIGWFFTSIYYSAARKRLSVGICLLSSVVILYIAAIRYNFVTEFSSYCNSIVNLTTVVYCFLYFHQILTDVKEENLLANFDLWIICTYTFYSISTFFIIIFYESNNYLDRGNLWIVQNAILLISSLILIKGYLVVGKTRLE